MSVALMGSYNYLTGNSGIKTEVSTGLINVAQSSFNNIQNQVSGQRLDFFENSVITQDVLTMASYVELQSVSTNILTPYLEMQPVNTHLLFNPTASTAFNNYSHYDLRVLSQPSNTLMQTWTDTPADGFNFNSAIPDFSVDNENEDFEDEFNEGDLNVDIPRSNADLDEIFENQVEVGPMSFAKLHKEEIETLYETKREVGRWKKLGNGNSKIAFTHEDFPGWLIKIPSRYPNKLLMHHKNLEDLKGISSKFDRISLPESYLFRTAKGEVIVEEMFNLKRIPQFTNDDQKEAELQFMDFKRTTGLCDLDPKRGHNAGIIAGSKPTKIGIIDFDCRNDQLFL